MDTACAVFAADDAAFPQDAADSAFLGRSPDAASFEDVRR